MRSIPILISTFSLFLLSLLPSIAQHRIEADTSGTLQFPPRLTVIPQLSDMIAALPQSAAEKWRTFRGIAIEVDSVKEFYPLLTTLFFDRGMTILPSRYRLFKKREQTENFADDRIPGGTLQKYWQVLNIVGYRMKKYPETTIQLVGSYSKELGEEGRVAEGRTAWIRHYLIDIWRIDSFRITTLPVEMPYGDEADTTLQAELRSVRIESVDMEILGPIRINEARHFSSPDFADVRIDPMIPPEKIASCRIEAYCAGKLWRQLEFPYNPDSITYSTEWDWFRNNADQKDANILAGKESIECRGTLTLWSGEKIATNTVMVPILTTAAPYTSCCSGWGRRRLKRYTLLVFPRGESSWNSTLDYILAADIAPEIAAESHIQIGGYSALGEGNSTLELSTARAETATEQLLGRIDTGLVREIHYEGYGSSQPLFSNDLPEGRCYNRIVQILIQYPEPTEPKEWWKE